MELGRSKQGHPTCSHFIANAECGRSGFLVFAIRTRSIDFQTTSGGEGARPPIVSWTHCSVRRDSSDRTKSSSLGANASSSSLRCYALVTSSDLSPEKREPLTDDSSEHHACKFRSSELHEPFRWMELTEQSSPDALISTTGRIGTEGSVGHSLATP